MKPIEKAEELVHKYRMLLMNEDTDCGEEILVSRLSKQFALVSVDEMLNNAGFIWGKSGARDEYRKYWQEVKAEIEKL